MLVIMLQVALGGNINALVENLAVFSIAVFKLIPSANRINGSLNSIVYDLPSVNTVYEDLREAEAPVTEREKGIEADKSCQKLKFEQEVRVQALWYCYPDSGTYVLEDVMMNIPKGRAVAFVGESGSGKTTLADIILGILIPERGRILVDGKDIYENLPGWRKNIGYISQNIFLMDDTIRHNIAFGLDDGEIDDRQLRHAIEQAQLSGYVDGLPEGVDTLVGERGTRMSGGQRQRIGIARALYYDPELLIMDEATSALDQETERAVMESIEALYGAKTLIIIAHRLSTIERCDMVFEVKDKRVLRRK